MWKVFEYVDLAIYFTYYDCQDGVNLSHWFDYPDYINYYGPSSLAHIVRFIHLVDGVKRTCKKRKLVFKSDRFDQQRANLLFLMGSFMILKMNKDPVEAISALHPVLATVPSYRTEGEGVAEDYLEISDCLKGLYKGKCMGWLDWLDLNDLELLDEAANSLEDMEDPGNGDMSWIIPNRLLAMAGPLKASDPKVVEGALDLPEIMTKLVNLKIKAIVRLNRKHYESKDLPAGIQLTDLFINDGGIPTLKLIAQFQRVVRDAWKSGRAVAVHCRAGLGRTGTFIGTCLTDWFGFTAAEAIGYLRIVRPGSVIAHQTLFLKEYADKSSIARIVRSSPSIKIQKQAKRDPKRAVKKRRVK